jgi:pimeloyl-ACP methyl ester carboxylesterase
MGSFRVIALASSLAACAASCDPAPEIASAEQRTADSRQRRPAAAETPVSVLTRPVPGDLPVFVLYARPSAVAKGTAVFMHGMCGHGLGYVQSFQWAAASRANVVGLQGDIPCDGVTFRKWTPDLDALDERIGRALEAAGLGAHRDDVVLIGYSQGGTRAIELARHRPERYRRIVVIAAPHEANARELARVERVILMAGEFDAPRWRRSQAEALARAGIRAAYFELPGAAHAAMGPEAERVMGEVLDWILSGS